LLRGVQPREISLERPSSHSVDANEKGVNLSDLAEEEKRSPGGKYHRFAKEVSAALNCGWNVDWPPRLLERAEGLPLKNLTVTAGNVSVSGELLLTRYGIEGGAVYRLGPLLRAMAEPQITIDLKPQLTIEALRERLANVAAPNEWQRTLKLSPSAVALLEAFFASELQEAEQLIHRVKSFPLRLTTPRPIAEAISSAGGVRWQELDENLMLQKLPGVFVAGEMIDWEAPTGGYLLQGCFATGTRVGRAAAEWVTGAG